MKAVLVLAVLIAVSAFSEACDIDSDCVAGTVCCAGQCQSGTVCCSYGACPTEAHCCTAGDAWWPACCDPATHLCCTNWGANWCCPNTRRCGSFHESCPPQTTTNPPTTTPAAEMPIYG